MYDQFDEMLWDRIQSNPGKYHSIWQKILDGEINRDEMLLIIRADDQLQLEYEKIFRESISKTLELEGAKITDEKIVMLEKIILDLHNIKESLLAELNE